MKLRHWQEAYSMEALGGTKGVVSNGQYQRHTCFLTVCFQSSIFRTFTLWWFGSQWLTHFSSYLWVFYCGIHKRSMRTQLQATVLKAKQEVGSNQTSKSIVCHPFLELWVYACQLGLENPPDSALWMAVFSPLPTWFSFVLFLPWNYYNSMKGIIHIVRC